MLYRVQIRGHRWPVHALDIFPLMILVDQVGCMGTCIEIHKDEVWTNCTSEKLHMSFQYLVSVPLGIHSTSCEEVQICTSIEHYTCLHEYATTTKWAFFHDFCGMKPGSTFPPDYCAMGIIGQTKSGLVC